MRNAPKPRLVERGVVEAVAHILGPSSGAAQALQEANNRVGPAYFWDMGSYWLVTDREMIVEAGAQEEKTS